MEQPNLKGWLCRLVDSSATMRRSQVCAASMCRSVVPSIEYQTGTVILHQLLQKKTYFCGRFAGDLSARTTQHMVWYINLDDVRKCQS